MQDCIAETSTEAMKISFMDQPHCTFTGSTEYWSATAGKFQVQMKAMWYQCGSELVASAEKESTDYKRQLA